MSWFTDLITNPYLITGVSSWAIAQILKVIIYCFVNKKLDLLRIFGDGGMPSGHSATVVSLAVITALLNGTASFAFAVSAILAIIVCHDATGVRQEAGKHAVLLDQITEVINNMSNGKLSSEVRLKKFVGHTFTQVLAGSLVGAINAVIIYNFMI